MRQRRKLLLQEAPRGGAPTWMVTFSDVTILMLTFFVLFVSLGDVGEARKKGILEALGSELRPVSADTSSEVAPAPLERIGMALDEVLSSDGAGMEHAPDELRIRLDAGVVFEAGTTVLHRAGTALLGELGDVLARERVTIRVEGHAEPTGDERNDWRLASERAITVLMVLRNTGPIEADRLAAVGLGASHGGESAVGPRQIDLVIRFDG